jgi:hypothetical protein
MKTKITLCMFLIFPMILFLSFAIINKNMFDLIIGIIIFIIDLILYIKILRKI